MAKRKHEIRDPIYGFITYSDEERDLINSAPFQRLRYIRQLATSYLVYPGASHCRFEHSLGVMELCSKIYDTLFANDNLRKTETNISELLPIIDDEEKKFYWRRILRAAALCHDLGHLPFSHAAEKKILPKGSTHETISKSIILDKSLSDIWSTMRLDPVEVAKVAIGKKEYPEAEFNNWEILLSEIITGDVFGADRMDYLLRDSLHIGVAYGKFDHHRLIQTLRITKKPPEGGDPEDQSLEPTIGVERGGLQAAESLILARYLMFAQVYLHHVRRIYDIHLEDFMTLHYKDNSFPVNVSEFIRISDNEILTQILQAANDANSPCHEPASRIIFRNHYKKIYQETERDSVVQPDILNNLFSFLCVKLGSEWFKKDEYHKSTTPSDFPVIDSYNRISSAKSESSIFSSLPPAKAHYIFSHPGKLREATKLVKEYTEKLK